jgi:hypothetical protein
VEHALGVKTVGVQLNCLVEEAFSLVDKGLRLRFFDKGQAIINNLGRLSNQVERAVFVCLGERIAVVRESPVEVLHQRGNAILVADLRASKAKDKPLVVFFYWVKRHVIPFSLT